MTKLQLYTKENLLDTLSYDLTYILCDYRYKFRVSNSYQLSLYNTVFTFNSDTLKSKLSI